MVRIGAHVSVAGGLPNGITNARTIGAETIQIHARSPRSFRYTNHADASIAAFRRLARQYQIHPIFIHGIYLMNFATRNTRLLELSKNALIEDMTTAAKIGAEGVIFHLGSTKGHDVPSLYRGIGAILSSILTKTPGFHQEGPDKKNINILKRLRRSRRPSQV